MSAEFTRAFELIEAGLADESAPLIGVLAQRDEWDAIYLLSTLAGRELSVVFDADDAVHVDWGSPGQVPLHPPLGSTIPFRLWVHTHPHGHAYWSATDRNSLANGTLILAKAQVLGDNGILTSTRMDESADCGRLATMGPLARWSDEEVVLWSEWSAGKIVPDTSVNSAEVSA
ncbi:MAG: hypothetical protein QGH90_08125 [Candidatus Poseidoniaceae archaeon]|nr:hypothetical protein [Candidatus Poseidoniaceae archaeon]MDP7001853.1 hypothetical protein [Candidatus Poseidoniaceae archaeon]